MDAGIRLIAISGSLGGIGLAVTIFVVAGMLALVVQQRHREIALLRAIAATPRQVRRLIAVETFLVSLPAALAGVWPGVWLSTVLVSGLKDRGVPPGNFRHAVGPLPVFIAVASALLVVQVAAYLAGRRAARVRPTEALASAALQPGRIGIIRGLVGLVALAGMLPCSWCRFISVRPSPRPSHPAWWLCSCSMLRCSPHCSPPRVCGCCRCRFAGRAPAAISPT